MIPILETYNADKITRIISRIDGLLLTGGEDIHPKFYQKENIYENVHELMKSVLERDSFELSLLREAYKKKNPILGICRGHQLINVCFCGSLFDDIKSSLPNFAEKASPVSKAQGAGRMSNSNINHLASLEDKTQLVHLVRLKKGSMLEKIYQSEDLLVNIFHHQCIEKLANGFEVIAKSKDEVIEGIIYKGHEWIVGVQWHPEMLYKKDKMHGRLFNNFVKIVNKKAGNTR